MKNEMVLIMVDSGRTNKGADDVYRPLYTSEYTNTQVRKADGAEWAFIGGAWTMLRVDGSGLRYVVVNYKRLR